MVSFEMLVKDAPAVVTENLPEAVYKLIDMKKQGGFNVSLTFAGYEWFMSLTTFDSLPFDKKDVIISVSKHGCTVEPVARISPADAGYTKDQVVKQFGFVVGL